MNDLSRAWKGEIEEIERRKAAIVAKAKEVERVQAFTKCVVELASQGWIFRKVDQWHPHNNDTWIEHVFKSPRMKSFAPYSTKDDLITLEARIMGAYVMSDVGNARYPLIDDARRVLAEFFLTNPSASIEDAPKLTVSCSIS
jgi:hypothetical protein